MLLQAAVLTLLASRSFAETIAEGPNATQNASEREMYGSGQYLSSKCIKNAGVKAYIDFMNAQYKLNGCILEQMPNVWQDVVDADDVKILCNEAKENARACIENFLDKMAMCLPTQEQYLPKFLLHFFDDAVQLLCANNAIALQEYLEFQRGKKGERNDRRFYFTVMGCFMQIFPKNAFELGDEVIEEEDFCRYVHDTRICLVTELTEDDSVPNFLNKLVIKIADVASSICVKSS